MPLDLSQALTLGVVGTGAMGRGIAQICAAAGYTVKLLDAKPGAAAEAAEFVAKMLNRAAEKGWTTPAEARAAAGRLQLASTITDLADCSVVIEAIVEDLSVKRALFRDLEAAVADDAILATNTSSLTVTDIAAACRRPERVAGAHFFNPVPLMKLVEVIDGGRTAPSVGDDLAAFLKRTGHMVVRVKDYPGFLVNHAGRGYSTESLALLSEGSASIHDIDRVMRQACGFPMGPFELFDLTALDVSHHSLESSFKQFYAEPRFRPSPETARRMAAGLFGKKVGEGFYVYRDGKKVEPPEAPIPDARPASIWISPRERAEKARLVKHLKTAGIQTTIEGRRRPSDDALCIVTPLGLDATSAAAEEGLDPRRTVAVDTLGGIEKRTTVMATPLTEPAFRDMARGLLGSTGIPVTSIGDSPGFIAQRIVAAVVNVACALAQMRIGQPDEIDAAVRIGRGYPMGPLTMGDTYGAERIFKVLANMQVVLGDPRYRPSPWLRRRVQLGLSLKAPDLAP